MAAVIQMTSVNPQKSYLRRSLILTMKLLIAVVGLWYVISQISWHDRVFIDAGAKIRNVTVLERTSVRPHFTTYNLLTDGCASGSPARATAPPAVELASPKTPHGMA